MKRTPLERRTPLRRTFMRRRPRRRASMDPTVRDMVLRRDFHMCRLCGDRGAQSVHHILYRSQGGGDEPANLVSLCGRGNADGCHGEAHSSSRYWRPKLRALVTTYPPNLSARHLGWWPR